MSRLINTMCPRCRLREKLATHGYCRPCYNAYHRDRYRKSRITSLLSDSVAIAEQVFKDRHRNLDAVDPLPGVLWFLASECRDENHTHQDPWVVKEHPEYLLPENQLSQYLLRKDAERTREEEVQFVESRLHASDGNKD
jgi:hypothetical protein